MINRTLIENEVEILIKEFETTFPESYIFKKHASIKEKFINCLASLFNDQKVTSEFELEIHDKIIEAVEIPRQKKEIKFEDIEEISPNLKHMKWIYEQWGNEVGTLLLKSNRAIGKICSYASMEFNEKLSKLSST